MLTCKDASRLLSQRQDRTLSMRERLALQMHLAVCKGCALVSKQLEFMRRAFSEYAKRGAKPDDKG
jgi:hypothetical protein